MKKWLFGSIVFLALSACGPSAAEMAIREKAMADSVAFAVQQGIARQQAEAERQKAIADSIAAVAQQELLRQQAEAENRALMSNQIIELRTRLDVEEAKLRDLDKFHLMRTADEKERQMTNQARIVEELKAQVRELRKQLGE